ncbi:helix-turn-helix domain-containing protein [Mycobacterium sp. NPDC003449]
MTHPPDAKPRARHRTVDRVAEILEFAARAHAGTTLSEIAKHLGAPVSSVQGLVNGLVATGYLDERDRRYGLGSAPYLLNRLAGREPVSTVTHADLRTIHDRSGLTTVLSIAVGPNIFYVDYCSTDPRFAYLAENYVQRSLIRTSAGWVLLAGMDKRDQWAYLRGVADDEQPLIDRFFSALPAIEESGICAAPNASERGDGISIAVREKDKTVAAVGIISTHEEISARRDELTVILRERAGDWSARRTG